ncbi:MAG: hypothetical protein ACRC52_03850, partial [Aeromonas veronii]
MRFHGAPTIAFLNGTSAPLNLGFINCLMRNQKFQTFGILCVGIFALLRPYQSVPLERWQAITIIAAMAILVFICYLGSFAIMALLSDRLHIRRFRTLWVLVASALLSSYLGQFSLVVFGEEPKPVLETLLLCIFHFGMFAALE